MFLLLFLIRFSANEHLSEANFCKRGDSVL